MRPSAEAGLRRLLIKHLRSRRYEDTHLLADTHRATASQLQPTSFHVAETEGLLLGDAGLAASCPDPDRSRNRRQSSASTTIPSVPTLEFAATVCTKRICTDQDTHERVRTSKERIYSFWPPCCRLPQAAPAHHRAYKSRGKRVPPSLSNKATERYSGSKVGSLVPSPSRKGEKEELGEGDMEGEGNGEGRGKAASPLRLWLPTMTHATWSP